MSQEQRLDGGLAVFAHPGGGISVERHRLSAPLAADVAVVHVAFGGICGSDLHYWKHGAVGTSILRAPMVLGHEVSGTVLLGAADGSGPPAGAAVTVHPAHLDPGIPDEGYPAARPNLAPGVRYLGSAALDPHTEGAFTTAFAVRSAQLRELPAGVSLQTGALVEPAAVAWHAVDRLAGVQPLTGTALIIGGGPIGCLAAAILKTRGMPRVHISDLLEAPVRRGLALGADAGHVAPGEAELAGIGAETVLECSGSPAGLNAALRAVRRGGTVVMLGIPPAGGNPVDSALIAAKELTLLGSFRFHDAMDEVLAVLAGGGLDIDAVITHTFPVEQAHEAFELAAQPLHSGKVMLAF